MSTINFTQMSQCSKLPNQDSSNKFEKILIDANLIIDLLLDRCSPLVNSINDLFNILTKGKVEGYITNIGLVKIGAFTDIACQDRVQEALSIKSDIKNLLKVCEVRKDMIDRVKKSTLSNINAAIYLECLSTYALDAVITSDPDNFQSSSSNEIGSYIFTPCGYIDHYYESNLQELLHELGKCELQQPKNVIPPEKPVQSEPLVAC